MGMSSTTDKIRSRGHWSITIRPSRYDNERIPYSDLEHLLLGSVVRLRGWPVPMIDSRLELIRGEDWIGEDIDAAIVSHYEAWRFFTTGQFLQLRSISADWRTGTEATAIPEGCGSVIEVWEILFYLTEVFELAARLALTSAGDDLMSVEVQLIGLKERCLIVGQRHRAEFLNPYPGPVEDLQMTVNMLNIELVSNSRGAAVDMAIEMFARFGWRPSREQLTEHQQELLSYS
jgi:hypothetical protein